MRNAFVSKALVVLGLCISIVLISRCGTSDDAGTTSKNPVPIAVNIVPK